MGSYRSDESQRLHLHACWIGKLFTLLLTVNLGVLFQSELFCPETYDMT